MAGALERGAAAATRGSARAGGDGCGAAIDARLVVAQVARGRHCKPRRGPLAQPRLPQSRAASACSADEVALDRSVGRRRPVIASSVVPDATRGRGSRGLSLYMYVLRIILVC